MAVDTLNPDGAPSSGPEVGRLRRVGHLHLDLEQHRLHFLNEAARTLHREGFPLTPADAMNQRLLHPNGEPVPPDALPLAVALRENRAVEAGFLWQQPGGPAWRVSWTVSPTRDSQGRGGGLLATVILEPAEPDWRLLAELSHDLRTPLNTISIVKAVLDSRLPTDPTLAEVFQRMGAAADRALEISQDLLECCRRPFHQGRPVEPAWIPLNPFLKQLAQEHGVEAQRKGLALDLDLAAAEDWEIYLDRVRLGRLLSNLLTNAIRYTPQGRVEVQTAWREDKPQEILVLSVVDTGSGILLEEQESIFAPFQRGQAARESASSGSGLGLASVEDLVKELG
ncbi:MAG: HAMP domain-containing histidine kinase, partial [Planctomycetes bacterium]|nr:HAMP domain-containing histidine kinase [Planctomycetota bacterium]